MPRPVRPQVRSVTKSPEWYQEVHRLQNERNMVTLELDTIANKSQVVAKEGEDERMKNISMEAWLKQN